MNKRIHIFVGHFGSGKTEVSVNFAIKQANAGKNVSIVDLDTVNPYFRTADATDILRKYGINVIASEFAGTNVDIPVVPGSVASIFSDENIVGIFDVGGDEDGAYALGRYKNEFEKSGYCMHFVVNVKRPMTQNAEDIVAYIQSVEQASRLKVTDIFNNTNLANETSSEVLMSGCDVLGEVSEITGLPVLYNCGTKKALEYVENDRFEIEIFIKMPWDN